MDMLGWAMLVGGAGALWAGGEALVSGSVSLARRLRLSPVLIGVVLMGFGTSMPEFVTSLDAALAGKSAIAIGNAVGSNICNILLILGLAALIAPIRLDREALRPDAWAMMGAAVFLALAAAAQPIDVMEGAFFVLCLFGYLGTVALAQTAPAHWSTGDADERGAVIDIPHAPVVEPWAIEPRPVWQSLLFAFGGLAALLAGARFFVDGAVELSRAVGLSEAVIGATVVAVGTSLPELVASVAAARRGESELSVGNILGSNIFNIFGVLGATALVLPLEIAHEVYVRDLPVMLAATALLVALILLTPRIGRLTGLAMLVAYAGYLAWSVLG